jgi:hypothetical protein
VAPIPHSWLDLAVADIWVIVTDDSEKGQLARKNCIGLTWNGGEVSLRLR